MKCFAVKIHPVVMCCSFLLIFGEYILYILLHTCHSHIIYIYMYNECLWAYNGNGKITNNNCHLWSRGWMWKGIEKTFRKVLNLFNYYAHCSHTEREREWEGESETDRQRDRVRMWEWGAASSWFRSGNMFERVDWTKLCFVVERVTAVIAENIIIFALIPFW